MEVVLDPSLGLGSGIIIPADLRQAPPPVQLDPEHTTHPAQRYQEICQRFGFARSYIGRLYSERHELELENGRLRRHRSRQSSAVSRLQVEVERLRTRLEVEGIPLDSSDEDEDGSSFDDVPPSPPPPAVADRSMAYFPDRISRQYGTIQRVPRVHNFESGLITSHLLTNLADRWQSRNTVHLDEGMTQDIVTPAYANWFFALQ
ncbi:hypothetical protein JCGZ_07844 [Jatropha curcas]|uniref:Aminotransferase-like plant mobile domain-containing protein n=1 Tax=Jatropha curcas TaxID=180498 RepID=A0A067L0M7_JATCU|nr:hypothetical protein JCGZ_07844 [Jatropha curcas]